MFLATVLAARRQGEGTNMCSPVMRQCGFVLSSSITDAAQGDRASSMSVV
jgi:hypothetical protein